MWIRALLQDQLSQLGYFLQRHAGKVLFVAILALAILCVALKSAQVNSKVEQLWVQGKRLFMLYRSFIVLLFLFLFSCLLTTIMTQYTESVLEDYVLQSCREDNNCKWKEKHTELFKSDEEVIKCKFFIFRIFFQLKP